MVSLPPAVNRFGECRQEVTKNGLGQMPWARLVRIAALAGDPGCLLQIRSGLLPVCYAEVWLLVQFEGVRVAGDSYLN